MALAIPSIDRTRVHNYSAWIKDWRYSMTGPEWDALWRVNTEYTTHRFDFDMAMRQQEKYMLYKRAAEIKRDMEEIALNEHTKYYFRQCFVDRTYPTLEARDAQCTVCR